MARYEHLPIYRSAMDLTVYLEKIVHNFSRYNKYTLGSELRNKSRELVVQIIKANSAKNKASLLLELGEKIEELKITVRVCKETKAFYNFNSFNYCILQLVELGKQNQGWLRSAGPELPP